MPGPCCACTCTHKTVGVRAKGDDTDSSAADTRKAQEDPSPPAYAELRMDNDDDGSVGGVAPESAPPSASTETQATDPPTSTLKQAHDNWQAVACDIFVQGILLVVLLGILFYFIILSVTSMQGAELFVVWDKFSELMGVKLHALSMCARIFTGDLYNVVVQYNHTVHVILTATNISSVPVLNASTTCCACWP